MTRRCSPTCTAATLQAGEARAFPARGLSMASGYLASPTRGGQSWAGACDAGQRAVDRRADALWRGAGPRGRHTLFHLAQDAGFSHRRSDAPDHAGLARKPRDGLRHGARGGRPRLCRSQLQLGDHARPVHLCRDGPSFLRGDRPRRCPPVSSRSRTGSSHAPWVPVPELVEWDAIGDGRIFDADGGGGRFRPTWSGATATGVRAQYPAGRRLRVAGRAVLCRASRRRAAAHDRAGRSPGGGASSRWTTGPMSRST